MNLCRSYFAFLAATTLVSLFACGCADSKWQLNAEYGKVRGVEGGGVNGFGAFADMFEERGHSVSTWKQLSPRLNQADVIVWAPDDYEPPRPAVREWLEDWLAEKPRTLIYIGRDYDSEPDYWRSVLDGIPADARIKGLRRQAFAEARVEEERSVIPDKAYTGWFISQRRKFPPPTGTVDSYQTNWSDVLEQTPPELKLGEEFSIPLQENVPAGDWVGDYTFEALVVANSEPFAFRVQSTRFSESQILVVANSSTLANYPLAKSGNYVFADMLIDELDYTSVNYYGDNVVFLESDASGMAISSDDPATSNTGLEPLTVYPVNLILLHLLAVGIILCIAWFPHFGRPHERPRNDQGDFGRYLKGIGALLARTGNRAYAEQKLEEWRRTSKSGE